MQSVFVLYTAILLSQAPSPSPAPPSPPVNPAPAEYGFDLDGGNAPGTPGCFFTSDEETCITGRSGPVRDACTSSVSLLEVVGPATCTLNGSYITQEINCNMYCAGLGKSSGVCDTMAVAACGTDIETAYCRCND